MSSTEVYAIRNRATGALYIGESTSAKHRWQAHRSDLRRGHHHNRALQAAWDRDGATAFDFVVLEHVATVALAGAAWRWAQERRWVERAQLLGAELYNDQIGRGKVAA